MEQKIETNKDLVPKSECLKIRGPSVGTAHTHTRTHTRCTFRRRRRKLAQGKFLCTDATFVVEGLQGKRKARMAQETRQTDLLAIDSGNG